LGLIASIRELAPEAGIRSNVIVGFPGETEADVEVLCDFLTEAGLDAIGVFGYSDEDGTEAATLDGHLDLDEVERRRNLVADLADELVGQRAEDRIGETVQVLVEEVTADGGDSEVVGRAAHQGPEVDGSTRLVRADGSVPEVMVGEIHQAVVIGSEGVDLVAALSDPTRTGSTKRTAVPARARRV
jgi:ribosomal protein S12 methylthiotransferase